MDNREIDILVAEKVMGQTDFDHLKTVYKEDWNLEGSDGWSGFVCPRCNASEGSEEPCVARYSADIAAAWQVVEKLAFAIGTYPFSLEAYIDDGLKWCAEFDTDSDCADTAPLAICLAALKVVESNSQ